MEESSVGGSARGMGDAEGRGEREVLLHRPQLAEDYLDAPLPAPPP